MKRLFSLVIAALFIGSMSVESVLASADQLASTALELQARGNYERAAELYAQALETGRLSRENSVFVYNNRARILYLQGQLDAAIQDFTSALQLNPNFIPSYLGRGAAWDKQGALDKAIADYTAAIELKPEYTGAWFNRGRAWYLKKEYARAVDDLTRTIELSPEFGSAYLLRAYALYQLDDYSRANVDATLARKYDRTIEQVVFSPPPPVASPHHNSTAPDHNATSQ